MNVSCDFSKDLDGTISHETQCNRDSIPQRPLKEHGHQHVSSLSPPRSSAPLSCIVFGSGLVCFVSLLCCHGKILPVLHEVHLGSWHGGKWIGVSQDRLVVHHRLWCHHRDSTHLPHLMRRHHSINRQLLCRHGKSDWRWSQLWYGHSLRSHECVVAPVGGGACGFGLPVSPPCGPLLYQVGPLELWLFGWCFSELQVTNKAG